MAAKYIIRLDDASEHMDYAKWNPYFELFDKHNIKPIIAVIPFNRDIKMVIKNPDDKFWDKVRLWQQRGYHIALHGYEHVYSNAKSGIIGLNKYSEFAGILIELQQSMLAKANRKFEEEGINANIFVAPAHSFDKNTLVALKKSTNIKYVSDGFYLNPILKDGFNWIPQQLWKPETKSKGVWTICYHPETMEKSDIYKLETFIRDNCHQIVDPLTLNFNEIKFEDYFFLISMKMKIKLLRIINYLKKEFSLRFSI